MRVRFRREKPLLAQSRAGDLGCRGAGHRAAACRCWQAPNPDGLEWTLFGNEEAGYSANMGLDEEAYGAESAAAEKAAAVQEKTSLLPDYNFAGSDSAAGTSVSGLVGCALVAALAAITSLAGRAARKRSGKKQASAG